MEKELLHNLSDIILEDLIEREFKLPYVPHEMYILMFNLRKSI